MRERVLSWVSCSMAAASLWDREEGGRGWEVVGRDGVGEVGLRLSAAQGGK